MNRFLTTTSTGFTSQSFEKLLREAEKLHTEGFLAEAAECYRMLLIHFPQYSHTAYNLGLIMIELEDYVAAETAFRQALLYEPGFFEAELNLAFSLQEQGRISEALSGYLRLVQLRADSIEARFNLACLQLLLGNLKAGWTDYELRFFTGTSRVQHHKENPVWNGDGVAGLKLLVHTEQGYGDAIQMARYLPLLVMSGMQIYLETTEPLTPLLGRTPGLAGCIARGEPLPSVDVHVPLMSLPGIFRTTLDTIPPPLDLFPDRLLVSEFKNRIADRPGLRVGICWTGRLDLPVNRKRSCSPDLLKNLLTTTGVSWVSLQAGQPAGDVFPDIDILDLAKDLQDFGQTAALISTLDLVVSIDTAVAHLAATVGVQTWLMLPHVPDWRWLLERDDSPWYPAMRIFRQPHPGAWGEVIQEVRQALIQQSVLKAAEFTNRGAMLDDEGRYEEAVTCYLRALAICPDNAVTWYNYGNTLNNLGQKQPAIAAFLDALRHNPVLADAHHNLALLYREQGLLQNARDHLECALRLRPDFADALQTRGEMLAAEERFDESIAIFRQVLEQNPDRHATWNMLGITLQTAERDLEAVSCYRTAIRLDPENLHARNNLGAALLTLGKIEESTQVLKQLLDKAPDYRDGHWNLAGALLAQGDWKEGWAEFEYRFSKHSPVQLPQVDLPLWDGSNLGGKGILLQGEQAFGDTIQFIRFATAVAERGGVVHVACQHPALVSLLSSADKVVTALSPMEPYPASCVCRMPLMSLPHVLGMTLDQLPATVPYLHPKRELVDAWRERLSDTSGIRIGVCWSGRQTLRNRRRSCPPELLEPLGDLSGVSLFNLQVGGCPPSSGLKLIDLTDYIHDFSDSAALITCLDLVITIDTAVAHLAGALGKPVWLMLPDTVDWRWMAERDDSPWYPTMRIFRQNGDCGWPGLIQQVVTELRCLTDFRVEHALTAGDAFREEEKWDEALQQYLHVLQKEPEQPQALLRAGGCLMFLNRHDEAVGHLRQAVRYLPEDPDPHINLAICHLAARRFREGWQEFEWRRRYITEAMPPIPELSVLGTGVSLDGVSILVHCEQGFGDMLQFCRYLPLLSRLGATVTFSVPKELTRLFGALGSEIRIIPHGEHLPVTYFQTLLMSLPRVMRNYCPDIPDAVPYLSVSDDLSQVWRERLSHLSGLRIGLAWQGRNMEKSGYQRSLGLQHLQQLLELPDCSFVSLHPQQVASHPRIHDFSGVITDFADTAALMSNLDLIVTVDTAVAHLAGALGLACRVALLHSPDWRWFPIDRKESAWYPTLQLFRQPKAGDWDSVMCRIRESVQGELYLRRGHTLGRDGDLQGAIEAFQLATAFADSSAAAWLNMGIYLHAAEHTSEGISALNKAVELDPAWPEAWQNLGMLYQALRKLPEAYNCFRKALLLRPGYQTAKWNLALLQLLTGEYAEGFKNFEARFDKIAAVGRLHQQIPVWDRSSLAGRKILVYAEQGYGDTIQFIRFLPLLSKAGGMVVLEVQDPSLAQICRTANGVDQVVVRGEKLPPVDFQMPLLSLPNFLGCTFESIPRKIPYLSADINKISVWRERLSYHTEYLIGICWKGRSTPDHRRSIPLDALQALWKIPGARWVSLCFEQAEDECLPDELLDFTGEISCFGDTAALVSCLDMVISIDSAVAHLAGALGMTGYVLLPFAADWRWGLTEEIAPWYPTLRLLRQNRQNDWDGVIEMLVELLCNDVQAKSAENRSELPLQPD